MYAAGPLTSDVECRVRASIARQSMLTALGITADHLAMGQVELGFSHRDDLCQQHGFVHAGAITTAADSACGYAALTLLPADRDVLTVGFSMNLTAPASHRRFVAIGEVVRSGRKITVCRGEVYGVGDDQERTLVALIQATMSAVTMLSEGNRA